MIRRMLSFYSTPSLLLRRQFDNLNLADELLDDLLLEPRMEIWPTSRLHRGFFNRQLLDLNREMNRLMDFTDQRLQALSQENAEQKLKVIEDGEKEFKLNLAVKQFKPEEIQCKVDGNYLTVEGKNETKDEKTGSVSKSHFVRRVLLPENTELDKVNCTFKADGTLAITIPKKQLAIQESPVKTIPIQYEK